MSRKHRLFVGGHEGGAPSAVILTVIANAHRHDLDAWTYLQGNSKTTRQVRNRSGAALAGCLQRHSSQHVRTFREEERELPAENRRYQATKRRLEPLTSSGIGDATIERNVADSTIISPSPPPAVSVPGRPPPGKRPLRALSATSLAPTMFASDSAVVSTSCATSPQAGLRATHARPRTKRPLQLTRGPPPASVGVGAPLRLPRATPVRTWSPCVAELCRARHARSQNPGTKGRTSDNGRRRSRPAILTPSRLAHCHATPADGPSLTVIFDAYRVLANYARDSIVSIEDISEFVHEQHQHVLAGEFDKLLTPKEDVYPIDDAAVRRRLGLP